MPAGLDVNLENKERKHRSKLEIARDVLLVASVRTRKTRIMYMTNLSFRLIEKYLKGLVDSGLVESGNDSCYLITRKGKEFLQMYADYVERCRKVGDYVNGVHQDRLLLENMCFNNNNSNKRVLNNRETLV